MFAKTFRRHLALGTALSLACASSPALAQLVTAGDLVDARNGSGSTGQAIVTTPNAGTSNISVLSPVVIANWNRFNVPSGSTLNVSNASSGAQAALLNRVIGGNFSDLGGTINAAGVNLWVINSNGILFGSNTAVSAKSFFASTLDLADPDFFNNYSASAGSELASHTTNLVGFGTPIIVAPAGATFTTDGTLLFAGPGLNLTGTFNAGTGQAAFVAGSNIVMSTGAGSPLTIAVNAGTTVSGQTISGTVSGRRAEFVMVTASGVTNALLQVDASVTTTAVASENGISIYTSTAGGSIPNVTVNGALTSSGGVQARLGSASTNGLLTLNGPVSGSTVALAGNSIAAQTISANGGTVDIDTYGGAFSAGNITATNGVIDLDSFGGGDLTLGNLTATVGIGLDTSGAVSAGSVSAGGSLNVGSSIDPSRVTFSGNISATNVDIDATGALSAQAITATGSIDIDTGSVSAGALSAAGILAVDSAGPIALTSAIANSDGIGSEALVIGASVLPSTLTISGAASGGRVDLQASGNLQLGNVTSTAGFVDLDSTSGAIAAGAVSSSGGTASLTAPGTISTTSISSSAGIDVDSTGGGALSLGNLQAMLPIALDSSGSLAFGNVSASAAQLAIGDTTLPSSITSGGAVNLLVLSARTSGALTLDGANSITSLGTIAAGGDVLITSNGNLAVGGIVSAPGRSLTIRTTGNLTVDAAGRAVGGTVALSSAGNFVNNRGADAISASKWVVYSNAPSGNVFGGLNSGNTAIWNRTITTLAPSGITGNRYVFAFQPTLVVSSTDASKTYGTDLTGTLNGNYTISGLQPAFAGAYLGDSLASVLSGTPAVTSAGAAANADVSGSPYVMTINQGSLGVSNGYQLLLSSAGRLSITPKAIGATVTANDKTYDGTTAASGSVALTGVIAGDSVGTAGTSFTFADRNAGSGKTVTVAGTTLTGADAGNYTLTVPASTLADIFAKAIGATVTANDKTYDGTTAASGSVALTGVIAGDSVGTAGTSFTFADRNAGSGKTVTVAGTTLTGADAGNYTLTVPASTLADIFAKAIGATVTANDKTYDGTTAASGSVALTGVIAGDSVGTAGTSFTFADRNAGSGTTVTVAGTTLTGADAGNYTLTVPASTLADIFAKAIGATVTANDKTYDGTTAASGSVALTGVIAGDSVGTAGTSFTFADRNAGSGKTVTVAGTTLTGADAGNYTLTVPASTLADIFAKAIGATVTANDKTYDGTTAASGSVALTGVIAGDSVGTAGTSFTFADRNAGSGKTVTVAGTTLTGADAGNYTLTVPASTLADIARRALSIAASDAVKVQGAADPALSYTVTSGALVGGDTISGALVRDPGEAPGNYAIRQGSLAGGPNYTITFSNGALTITPVTVPPVEPDPQPAIPAAASRSALRTQLLPSSAGATASGPAGLELKSLELCDARDSKCQSTVN